MLKNNLPDPAKNDPARALKPVKLDSLAELAALKFVDGEKFFDKNKSIKLEKNAQFFMTPEHIDALIIAVSNYNIDILDDPDAPHGLRKDVRNLETMLINRRGVWVGNMAVNGTASIFLTSQQMAMIIKALAVEVAKTDKPHAMIVSLFNFFQKGTQL